MHAARLRRTKDIAQARAQGRAWTDRSFTMRAHPTELGLVRVAVSASRHLGSATRRNRARRRLREAVRLAVRPWPDGPSLDLVLAVRPGILETPLPELRSAIGRAIAGAAPR